MISQPSFSFAGPEASGETMNLPENYEQPVPRGRGTSPLSRLPLAADRPRILARLADGGRGLPPCFDIGQATSLGLRLASNLARSMGGQFTVEQRSDRPGTVSRLAIPVSSGGVIG